MGSIERNGSDENSERQVKDSLSIIYLDGIIDKDELPSAEEVASNFYFYKKSLEEKVSNPITKGIIQGWAYDDLFSVVKEQEGYGWRLVEDLLSRAEAYSKLEFPDSEK